VGARMVLVRGRHGAVLAPQDLAMRRVADFLGPILD
jgi:hypothetical protein